MIAPTNQCVAWSLAFVKKKTPVADGTQATEASFSFPFSFFFVPASSFFAEDFSRGDSRRDGGGGECAVE